MKSSKRYVECDNSKKINNMIILIFLTFQSYLRWCIDEKIENEDGILCWSFADK